MFSIFYYLVLRVYYLVESFEVVMVRIDRVVVRALDPQLVICVLTNNQIRINID